jgi:hypothetical protein
LLRLHHPNLILYTSKYHNFIISPTQPIPITLSRILV